MRLENASTIEKDSLKNKAHQQQKKKSKNIRIYHSFLTFVLILCVLQLGYSAIFNVSKIIMYQGKINKSIELRNKAQERNAKLKNDIQGQNSLEQVESIARNNLKMAGEDEILIIINQVQEETPEPKTLKEKILYHFAKQSNNQ